MKTIVALVPAFSRSAEAHESLAPHEHPHELRMLLGTEAVAYALVALTPLLWLRIGDLRDHQGSRSPPC